MRRKKNKESPEPSAPAWMATYGDMVTLILVFFVLLFSFSTIDAGKWKSLVEVLSGGSGILDIDPNSLGVVHQEREDNEKDQESASLEETEGYNLSSDDGFIKLYEKIRGYVDLEGLSAELDIVKGDSKITIRFKDNIIFDSGMAVIKKEAVPILIEIGEILTLYKDEIGMIMIEGHTDNVPINTSRFPDNWELSSARALTVLRFFIEERSMDPKKLSAIGYGEYHPVAPNDTVENKAQNRRVDIVIAKVASE